MTPEPVYEEIPEDASAFITKADLQNFERRLRSELPKMVTQLSGGDRRSKHELRIQTRTASS